MWYGKGMENVIILMVSFAIITFGVLLVAGFSTLVVAVQDEDKQAKTTTDAGVSPFQFYNWETEGL